MTQPLNRRTFLCGATATVATVAGAGVLASMDSSLTETLGDTLEGLLQKQYQRMTPEEIQEALARIERRARRRQGVTIRCVNTPPRNQVTFGFALNLSRCIGARRCVEACFRENNCSEHNQPYIRVISLPKGSWDLTRGDHGFNPATVPEPDRWYLPVQCQQCEDPACVQACPVGATWQEPDGVVVIDYDWCIGCRYCQTACPYWARRFNWREPLVPAARMVSETHYLGNRPRMRGVMEKCTFCLQRTRQGRQPACQEACPTGARIFGNLLDPEGELRYVLEHKTVYRLKEELHTEPKFWYFTDV
ncbi:MAG: 4Fe-4S dicluster domain-containing protein [Magnetococcales bacterium]|nr:4Fe-4S dicluster domain-containing protein [Magnetococcales bacterium]